MICILAFGPRGMAELAQCLGVEKATLTGVADRAERRGLVIRSPVPGDRRALDVTLTATGRRTAAEFHADAVREAQSSPLATHLGRSSTSSAAPWPRSSPSTN